MANAIKTYTAAQIAKIESVGEAAYVKGMADAAAVFYKTQDDWENSQRAKEVALRSVRQAGIILLPPDQGGRTTREQGKRTDLTSRPNDGRFAYEEVLQETGISEATGRRWQKVARVPGDKFEAYFAEAAYKNEEYSVAGLMKFSGEWFGLSNIAEWETPSELFNLLNDEFNLQLDVCASEHNAKTKKYFDKETDGLKQNWGAKHCWMNPPYGREIPDWMDKASAEAKKGALVVCLVPARTDTEWWWNNVITGEVRFLRGRLKFSEQGSAPFPSAVVIRSNVHDKRPRVLWWDKWAG
mgnify:CR=1 FL=1